MTVTLQHTQVMPSRPVEEIRSSRDLWSRYVGITASVISVAAFVYFHALGSTLYYKDATSHMEIARRVVDSPTTGFGQLGGVWLPLPHILMLPFIGNDTLYYSGIAGSLASMVGFVITSVLLYKMAFTLTRSRIAALVCAGIFMTNPSVLYMQSTPMTELLMFACIVGAVYGVQRWIQTDNSMYLVAAGIAAVLGSLTRYEAWMLLPTLGLIILIVSKRYHFGYAKSEGLILAFGFVGGIGVLGWVLWNLIIFRNPLNFQNGEYAKPSLWVGSADKAVGHLGIAMRTYWYASVENLSLPVVIIAIACLALVVAKRRLNLAMLPALSMLVFAPFFVLMLENGQRPLHVRQVSGDLYNIRFGLIMILPAAIIIGLGLACLSKYRVISLLGLGLLIVVALPKLSDPSQIGVYREPELWAEQSIQSPTTEASTFLRENYDSGLILSQFFGNETLLFDARISLIHNLYEGSYKLWEPALNNPAANKIDWIVFHKTNDASDIVTERLTGTPQLQRYEQVFQNTAYAIYQRKAGQ